MQFFSYRLIYAGNRVKRRVLRAEIERSEIMNTYKKNEKYVHKVLRIPRFYKYIKC